MFGMGMILARGCSSRLLVLAAQGNLRALLSGLVFAVTAQSALTGCCRRCAPGHRRSGGRSKAVARATCSPSPGSATGRAAVRRAVAGGRAGLGAAAAGAASGAGSAPSAWG
jgi:hypothetical protein